MVSASKLRVRAAARDGWKCHYCSTPLVDSSDRSRCIESPETVDDTWWTDPDRNGCGCGLHSPGEACIRPISWSAPDGHAMAETDHKVPRCRGGTDDMENIVLACGDCNSRKNAKPYEVFVRLRAIS